MNTDISVFVILDIFLSTVLFQTVFSQGKYRRIIENIILRDFND